MGVMDDLFSEFILECSESLDLLDQDLIDLEQRPGDGELLKGIFRYVHTIKGNAGCLGFGKLESVTHVGENLLSLARDGSLSINPEIISVLLRMLDALREMLSNLESTGSEGDTDYGPLIADLKELAQSHASEDKVMDTPSSPAAEQVRVTLDGLDLDFVKECHEAFGIIDTALQALRAEPAQPGPLGEIAAAVHTLAIISGPLEKPVVEELAEVGESFITLLKDGPTLVSPASLQVLNDLFGALKDTVATLESTGREGQADHGALLTRLKVLPAEVPEVPKTAPPSRLPPQARRRWGPAQFG